MATIAFLIEHEEGHLNPTFRLARRLAARGHRLVYLGLADGGDLIRKQGFELVPILEDLFPRGTIRTLREMARTGDRAEKVAEIGAAAQAGPRSAYARSFRGMLDGDEALDRTMRELRPDLIVLTSSYVPHAVILRNRYGLPIVILTTFLRSFPKTEYAAELGRLLMYLGDAKDRLAALLAGNGPARAAGLAPRILAQVLRMRELILCPQALELPGQSHEREPEVHYVEPNVDLERRTEGPFPWEALDPSRRLLYVSLGSQSYVAGRERVAGLLRAVSEAFAARPDWQVVLSTGSLLDPAEIPAPPGGIVTGWAPQLELLRRASVAVAHAGLGTVKECIVCGVPLVVFPFLLADQPENARRVALRGLEVNARRVVHHGLGVQGDLGNVSASSIASLVEQAGHPDLRASVERMRQRFLEVESSGIGVQRIEELLFTRREPSPPSPS
jgi:MGT family glycosyltransferase